MSKVYYGCPTCGCREVKACATVRTDVNGSFVGDTGEFDPDGEAIRNDFEIEEVEEYECTSCGESFDEPAKIYDEQGPRLRLRLSMEVVHTKAVRPDDEEDEARDIECAMLAPYYAEDDEKDGPSKTFAADIPIGGEEAANMAFEAAKAFFQTMLIKQSQMK